MFSTTGSPTYLLAKFLAKKRLPLAGNTCSFIKNSMVLVDWVKNLGTKNEDILVNFDIVSLYTKIPMDEAIEVIKNITKNETTNLVKIFLKSTYFSFNGKIYE